MPDVDELTEDRVLLEAVGAPIPGQCDGRSLAPFLAGAAPVAWRDEAHWEFDFRDPSNDDAEQALGLTLHQCALNVVRGERYKYVHFTRLPPQSPRNGGPWTWTCVALCRSTERVRLT